MSPLNLIPTQYRLALYAAAVALVVGLVYALGDSQGSDRVQAQWDSATIKQSLIVAQATQDFRNKERLMQQQKDEALNAAAEREKKFRADSAAAHAATLSLRHTIADLRSQLSIATVEACRRTAETSLVVFGECSDRYRAVAEDADRLGTVAQTLSDAWPK